MEDSVRLRGSARLDAPALLAKFRQSNMTARQFRYWLQQSLSDDLPVQLNMRVFEIADSIRDFIEPAIQHVMRESDSLRTRLVEEDGVPRIEFCDECPEILHRQLRPGSDVELIDAFSDRQWTQFRSGDWLHRHALLTTSDGRLLWAQNSSHLVCDGRSSDIMQPLIGSVAVRLSRGETPGPLDLPSLQDNMAEDRAREVNRDPAQDGQMWKSWARDQHVPFTLFGVSPEAGQDVRLRIPRMIAPHDVDQLYATAAREELFFRSIDASVANFMTAFIALIVWRFGGQRSQMFGVPFHGRAKGEERLIGFKSEVLPMRLDIDPDWRFIDLVQHVHARVAAVLKNRGTSIANPLHAPAYQIQENFSFQRNELTRPDQVLKRIDFIRRSQSPETVYGLHNNSSDEPGVMRFILQINAVASTFSDETRIGDGYHRAFRELIARPETLLRETDFVDAISRKAFDNSARPDADVHGQSQVAPGWLTDWISRLGDFAALPAISHGGDVMNHGALYTAACAWAGLFTTHAIRRGDRVIVRAPSSNQLAAAWLGLVSVGAVYVPVAMSTSVDQTISLAANTGAVLILSCPAQVDAFRRAGLRALPLDAPALRDTTPVPLTEPLPDSTAHIFHTSGSTGIAKPIAVTHKALNASITSWIEANNFVSGERIYHFYAITFDPWLTGLIPALRLAGSCFVAQGGDAPTRSTLLSDLTRHQITTLCTPTAYFHALCDTQLPACVRRWVVGGEALAADKALRFIAAQPDTCARSRLINAYGPTETTIWASILDVTDSHQARIPIGRPLPSCGFRVADEWGHYTPFGVPGELWISGPQVAVGYWNQPELTAQQFVERDGQRWYRTGDLVRWRKDGDLDFLGRADRQVQIRGHRVEPGEIEVALRQLPGIADAIVSAVQMTNTSALAAWVIPERAGSAVQDSQGLRVQLLRVLPEYKVPKWINVVDEFPRSANGKIDVTQLTAEQRHLNESSPDRLPTLTLWDLRFVFEEVLGVPRVALDDDFFELGGDSLLLVELLAAIERRFGKNLEAGDVIRHPTIGGLAPLLEAEREHKADLVVTLKDGSKAPLFCIPGAGGIGVEFYPLSRRLSGDQPVVVLRSSGTDGHAHPPATVDALLEEHVGHILRWRETRRETRPVQLMGYSLGGIFAWEVAQRLHGRGVEIGHVFLIDAHVATDAGRALFHKPVKSLRESVRDLVKGKPRDAERLQLAAELEASIAAGRIMEAEALGRYNLLVQAAFLKDIQSMPADFRTTYFLAGNGPRHEHAELWKQLAPDFSLVVVPGDHTGDDSIVREPNVDQLAKRLVTLLGD